MQLYTRMEIIVPRCIRRYQRNYEMFGNQSLILDGEMIALMVNVLLFSGYEKRSTKERIYKIQQTFS